jgi:hypothetical protein
MKDHDNWRRVALTNGWRFGDGIEQRYNEGRWDARGPLERQNPPQFLRIP